MQVDGGLYKVKKDILLKIVIGAILLPLVSMYLVNKFNFFSYFDFIPEDQRFDAGLGVYFAIFDLMYEYIVYYITKQHTQITVVLYTVAREENINNTPTVICSETGGGVASLTCHIKLEGNLKRLKKCNLIMPLPSWVSTQIPQNDVAMSFRNGSLTWDFANILPASGDSEQNSEYVSKIALIRNQSDNTLSVTICPQLKKEHMWDSVAVSFKTNQAIIQNRE